MNGILFAGYLMCCLALLCAQLALTIRECRQLGRRGATVIDPFYVRLERYLGVSFRSKIEEWLSGAPSWPAEPERRVQHGTEEIVVAPSLSFADDSDVDDVLVTDRFTSGARCRFEREIYVKGDCEIGERSMVQALAADGRVVIHRNVNVVRWLDAIGPVVVEPLCNVRGRLTSLSTIALGVGARIKSAHALVVATAHFGGNATRHFVERRGAPGLTADLDDWVAIGADRKHLRLLADDCVEYSGDLRLPTAVVDVKVVVLGTLSVGAGSRLNHDVKATGSLRIGARATCLGNLVAGKDVHLGVGVEFHGVVYAERHVRVGSGVLGRSDDHEVAVYGCETVTLGDDVWLHGKVAAGDVVLVTG